MFLFFLDSTEWSWVPFYPEASQHSGVSTEWSHRCSGHDRQQDLSSAFVIAFCRVSSYNNNNNNLYFIKNWYIIMKMYNLSEHFKYIYIVNSYSEQFLLASNVPQGALICIMPLAHQCKWLHDATCNKGSIQIFNSKSYASMVTLSCFIKFPAKFTNQLCVCFYMFVLNSWMYFKFPIACS